MSLLTEQKSQSEEVIWHQRATQKQKKHETCHKLQEIQNRALQQLPLNTTADVKKKSTAKFAFSENHEEKQLPGNAAGELLPFHSRKCANIHPHSVVCWLLRSWLKPLPKVFKTAPPPPKTSLVACFLFSKTLHTYATFFPETKTL